MKCIAPRCPKTVVLGAWFCETHIAAPVGQRGGWLSAEARRRRMAASNDAPLDASNITKRLWVGSKPPIDRDLPDFDVLVLCAQEIQPRRPELSFHGLTIHCPLPDSALSSQEISVALLAGKRVAEEIGSGRRVLVTCHAGLNRSALVAAFAILRRYRTPVPDVIELMRTRRSSAALSNPFFVTYLHRFNARSR